MEWRTTVGHIQDQRLANAAGAAGVSVDVVDPADGSLPCPAVSSDDRHVDTTKISKDQLTAGLEHPLAYHMHPQGLEISR